MKLGMAFLFALALILLACVSSNSLSGSQAAKLINESAEFKPNPGKIRLTDEEVKRGVTAGYWAIRQDSMVADYLAMTPKGNEMFAGFEPQIQGRILDLRQNMPMYVVQVTGIADKEALDRGGTERIVEFTCNYKFDQLPPEVRDLFQGHPPLQMMRLFRLYDDGWRAGEMVPRSVIKGR